MEAALLGVALTALGVGTPAANAADPSASPAVPHAVVVGAFPAPPAGPGPGTLAVWQPATGVVHRVPFGPADSTAGSSFYVAVDRRIHSLFVPTEAGVTKVVSTNSWAVTARFPSPSGSRVAKVTPNGRLVLVESAGRTAGYSTTAPYRRVFSLPVGGNALVIAPDGNAAFIGGNADRTVTQVALPSGRVVRRFAVTRSGDMVWAAGQIFSADIASGVMSVIQPRRGRVLRISTPEVDPTFTYSDIGAATAGFMQLAVGEGQRRVYAAGFSGHILAFSTRRDSYLGEVRVRAGGRAGAKLSGLLVLPAGRRAVVTAENLTRTLVVSLRTGRVLSAQSDLAANRWVLAGQN